METFYTVFFRPSDDVPALHVGSDRYPEMIQEVAEIHGMDPGTIRTGLEPGGKIHFHDLDGALIAVAVLSTIDVAGLFK